MRTIVALVLTVLGAFLVAAAVVAQAWAPGQVERTPLDTDNTTYLSGTAQVPDADFELQETPVLAFSTNAVDADRSDDRVAAWVSTLCLVRDEGGIDGCVDDDDPQGRLISAETDVFATDRHTGLTVNDDAYLPADATTEGGLQNKWPFGAEQKAYPVWDGLAGATVDAAYEGTQDINGLETYHYVASVDVDGVEVIDGVTGSYQGTTDYFVEPRTGAIIDQVVHQERQADGIGPILVLDLAFTAEQVQANVDDAHDNRGTLGLVEDTIPLVGYLAGVPAVLVGLALLLLGRRRRADTSTGAPGEGTD